MKRELLEKFIRDLVKYDSHDIPGWVLEKIEAVVAALDEGDHEKLVVAASVYAPGGNMNDQQVVIEAREAENEAMAHKIISSLAEAFGGLSQFGSEIVGLALLGQANNNWVAPLPVARAAAQLLEDRWEWDELEIYENIARAYNAEREQQGWVHTPELPIEKGEI